MANTRTIWTHLVFKHKGSIRKADEELALYRDADDSSETAYQKWTALHADVVETLRKIAEDSGHRAKQKSVKPGTVAFIWADAICSSLYGHHHD